MQEDKGCPYGKWTDEYMCQRKIAEEICERNKNWH